MESVPIRRALLSVSDKVGLSELARGLVAAGVELYSTGGTRKFLEGEGFPVRDVSEYTGFPEMMDGRLKTLHPKIFGGILSRRDRPDDMEGIAEHGIVPFDLVVVNLYPFESTVARPNVGWDQAIEQIDIGGPSLIRAAAKNHAFVAVVTRAEQYGEVLEQVVADGRTTLDLRRRLAAAAFAHTAVYDEAIAKFFQERIGEAERHPPFVSLRLERRWELRQGENPHQTGALYRVVSAHGPSLVGARQLNGKELSYNNLLDLDSALAMVRSFSEPAAVVIKHNNPCGAASASTLREAMHKALEGDPVSAFGSVLGVNRTVDEATAELLTHPGLFIEAIVAPDFEAAAFGQLTTKPKWKQNVRLMQVGHLETPRVTAQYRAIEGGMLAQESDVGPDDPELWQVVTEAQPTTEQLRDLRFGWAMVRHVKSNAIVLCHDSALVGVGAGQMSRVDSVEISIRKAGARARGAVLASDAFFPFPDSIDKAAEAGIAAIIQPGGSKQDDAVIAACNQHRLPMVLTGRRHFRH